jgi:hypothetical protein
MRQQSSEFLTNPVRIISPVNTRPVLGAQQECGIYFTSPQASFDAWFGAFLLGNSTLHQTGHHRGFNA